MKLIYMMSGLMEKMRITNAVYLDSWVLRIPAMYEVKNRKICNFWTFWPVIQLIWCECGIITEFSTKISRSAVFAACIAGLGILK